MRIQIIRHSVQLAFILLLFTAFFASLPHFMLIVLIATILGGAFYCGWLCPFGTMQEVANNVAGLFSKRRIAVPEKAAKYLVFLRYVFFALSLLGVSAVFFLDARISFLDMLRGDLLSLAAYSVVISFIIVSVFIDRLFCNYFCIQGAYFGVFSALRVFRIKREHKSCTGCRICDRICPMNIKISEKKYVSSLQCINCFKCTSKCPKRGALRYSFVDFRDVGLKKRFQKNRPKKKQSGKKIKSR